MRNLINWIKSFLIAMLVIAIVYILGARYGEKTVGLLFITIFLTLIVYAIIYMRDKQRDSDN